MNIETIESDRNIHDLSITALEAVNQRLQRGSLGGRVDPRIKSGDCHGEVLVKQGFAGLRG
jgi:hypothetical protein